MGGLPCAKQIIDNRNGLVQQLDCTNASILLAAMKDVQPTYEEAEDYKAKAEILAQCAAAIEKRVRRAAGV